jgi:hypothetical protein
MLEIRKEHEFFLEVNDALGNTIYREMVDPSLRCLVEDALFSAVCCGDIPNEADVVSTLYANIMPIFSHDHGRGDLNPYLRTVEVRFGSVEPQGQAFAYIKRYSLHPFKIRAQEIVCTLLAERHAAQNPEPEKPEDIELGVEASDQTANFSYVLSAFKPSTPGADVEGAVVATAWLGNVSQPNTSKVFRAVATRQRPFPLVDRPLSDFGLVLPEARKDQPYTVFIADDVVEEIIAHTLQAGGMEQAGVLIGHLCRDVQLGKVYALVTAHVPVKEGVVAGRDSFQFTPESFLAVKGLVELRQSDEIILGWQHNHHWCPTCPYNPSGRTIFFSLADGNVHASAFSQLFQVAIVAGRDLDLDANRPALRMFGWKDAGIAAGDMVRVGIGGVLHG